MKTPDPTKAESSAPDKANSKASLSVTPRERRLIDALWDGSPIPREATDRIAGASNSPHIIMEIRNKFVGKEGIDTIRVKVTDRDGKPTEPGRYQLTPIGRTRLIELGLGPDV